MEEAEACKNQPIDFSGLNIGSIVIVPSQCEYREGRIDKDWLAFVIPADPSSESHFDHMPRYVPYMVVTGLHLERRSHSPRVTLYCPTPLANRTDQYDAARDYGWNPADGSGHRAMLKPGLPLAQQNCSVGSSWAEWLDKTVQSAVPSSALLEAAKNVKPHISTYLL